MSRRWLGALVLAAVFATATVFLGRWQWHRHEEEVARVDRIEAHYAADPVPLDAVLPTTGMPLRPAQEWTRVRVSGRYVAGAELLVRNRPREGVYGYEVVVPLALDAGGALLVDRGWVPNGASAADLPELPPTPTGPVTVTGWLRRGETALERDLPAGQLASVDLGVAAAQTGQDLYGAYLARQREETGAGVGGSGVGVADPPLPLDPPDRSEGPNLAYAIQWWLAGPLALGLVLYGARREHLETRSAASGAGDPHPPAREPVPARARKVRIWDEEDG